MDTTTRRYLPRLPLKYGCNPQQAPAAVCGVDGEALPFRVISGQPGYINLLDALNAWQLVEELDRSLGKPAAASFKHVSPAGAAVAARLTPELVNTYEAEGLELTGPALAWLRARQADPLSSFGDFAALSRPVDMATARLMKTEVSDGLIAPGFEEGVVEVLKSKKGGKFIVLEADPAWRPPEMEYREVFGVGLAQRRNDVLITREHLAQRVTRRKELPPQAEEDLILAAITLKYTQSNSVGYALGGQMIGVGAGQQNRVDCVKLAGMKAETWFLRQHPKVLGLPFKPEAKKVDRTNARVRYIEGDFLPSERAAWEAQMTRPPAELTAEDRKGWLAGLTGVSLASDAFFPFRDSVDQAARRGVTYIVQPGGSLSDDGVIQVCDEYGMVMAFSGVRLFHH
ncbi:MAG: phosphoribosylaminoimidazolecarboxamide formyltransferase [Deltaproteobacteria bacterium]|nr:phosphoribosylaminoimidazolecarboxamide formyltransferase [Deltaproteobacteria bacterium]